MHRPAGKIRIGPAGWSYDDWDGIVYPRRKPRGFHAAEFLSQFFSTIEINTSFYNPPAPKLTKDWARRVEHNPDFQFTAKLWQRFTHDRNADHRDEKTFKESIAPLAEAGRLGALLMQFPWSFKNSKESREYLGGLVMQFVEYPLVVEVRHSSWNTADVYLMLVDLGVGFCNIDQPVIGRSIEPSELATSPLGYVRLHGRNYDNWFSSGEHPEERYNYLYSVKELEPWVERIRNVAEHSDSTFVITNNHFEGKGITNALQLTNLVTGKKTPVPETMFARYPELEAIAEPAAAAPAAEQSGSLFQSAEKREL